MSEKDTAAADLEAVSLIKGETPHSVIPGEVKLRPGLQKIFGFPGFRIFAPLRFARPE